jgi:carbamoyl-phosphate synthase small subunit
VDNARAILGQKPVFGICMGHQILGQAFGGKTFKLKFGHHGGNHPIRHNPSGMDLYNTACRRNLEQSLT